MRYHEFAESVKSDLRFVRSEPASKFLDDVKKSCKRRTLPISQNETFWRARVGCKSEVITTGNRASLVEKPYPLEEMKPIPNWLSEGRANPRGIPCLYVATTEETACAEVRPWLGVNVSIAKMRINRDLVLIDCSKRHEKENLRDLYDRTRSEDDGIWLAIDQAFATPVTKDNEARDYIPTQIIAELFKSAGYGGIRYKSLLSDEGYNFALFDLRHADVVENRLLKTESVSF